MSINSTTASPADVVVVGVNLLAGMTWMDFTSGILQIILTIVGIGAGIAAWRWHRAQRKALKKKQEDE